MSIFKGKDKSKKAKHEVRKVVGLFDLHAPLHEEPALRAALEFIKEYKPHELVIGGDLGEFESISHWIQNKKRKVEGKGWLRTMMRVMPYWTAYNKFYLRVARRSIYWAITKSG